MNIKERVESIQSMIQKFDDDVMDLDPINNFQYYSIFMPSLCIPYSIELRRRSDDEVVARLKIDYDDVFMYNYFVEELDSEFSRLAKDNTDEAQVQELKKIKEIFGV